MSGRYPIRAAAQLAGLPPETLRAWERRYGVVAPGRDDRGRLYSDDDVRKLRLLKRLVDGGHAIGRLARLSDEELRSLRLAPDDAPPPPPPPAAAPDISALLEALARYDEAGLEAGLARAVALLPARDFVLATALPLLRQVGEAWDAGRLSVAQEHLASAALRHVLSALLRTRSPARPRARLVFATPAGERHELGLLAAAMLAAGHGLAATYLGPDLPVEEIVRAARATGAAGVVLAATGAADRVRLAAQVALVASALQELPVLVGGATDGAFRRRLGATGARVVASLDDLDRLLPALFPAAAA